MIERFMTGLFEVGLQSATVGLVLILISIAACRWTAPWRFALLSIGLVKFALPPLPSPVFVDIPGMPIVQAIRRPLSGAMSEDIAPLLFVIWLGGALIQLSRLILARARLSRIIRVAARREPDAHLLDESRAAAGALGIPVPRVLVSNDVDAPLVTGLRHPTVILGANWPALDGRSRRLALLHEMAHVKRRDLLWVELTSWLSVVWWWHPVFRLLASQARAAQEDACDDLAILNAPEPDRYCRMLIEVAGRATIPAFEPALGFNGKILERRIRRLMNPRTRYAPGLKPAERAGIALLAIVLLAITGSHAVPRGEPLPRHLRFDVPRHHHNHHHGH